MNFTSTSIEFRCNAQAGINLCGYVGWLQALVMQHLRLCEFEKFKRLLICQASNNLWMEVIVVNAETAAASVIRRNWGHCTRLTMKTERETLLQSLSSMAWNMEGRDRKRWRKFHMMMSFGVTIVCSPVSDSMNPIKSIVKSALCSRERQCRKGYRILLSSTHFLLMKLHYTYFVLCNIIK